MKNNNMSGFFTITDPNGNKKRVVPITEFNILDRHYLVYSDINDEDTDFLNCCIVKIITENGENIIVDIEDDNEYLEVEGKIQELIEGEGEL